VTVKLNAATAASPANVQSRRIHMIGLLSRVTSLLLWMRQPVGSSLNFNVSTKSRARLHARLT
jgi:hypothetical protein